MKLQKAPLSPLSRTLSLMPPVIALTVTQRADADIFTKIEPKTGGMIEGETLVKGHEKWISTNSVQFGISSTATLGSGGTSAGKPTATPLTLSKPIDKSSPHLFLGCAQGTVYPKVTVELTKTSSNGEVVYYRITLENVLITSLNTSSNDETPVETVALTYGKITTDYFQQDQKTGNVPTTPTSSSTYDFVANK